MLSTDITTESLEHNSEINVTSHTNLDLQGNLSSDSSLNSSVGQLSQNNSIAYIHSAMLSVINFISIISNLGVIYLYITHKPLRVRANVIVMSLTSSDLLFATMMFIFSAMDTTTRRIASVTCVLVNFVLVNVSVTVSGWSLVALTIERYLSIQMPFQNRRTIPKINYFLAVTGIWSFSFVITGLMVAPWPRDSLTSTVTCGGLVHFTTFTAFLTLVIQAILPISIIASLYLRIACIAKRHRRAIQDIEMQILANQSNSAQPSPKTRQKSWLSHSTTVAKGTRVLFFASLSLIATWSPIFIVLQLFVFCTDCDKETMYYLFLFGSTLFHTKGFIHPLAYTLRDKRFKQAAFKTTNHICSTCKAKCLKIKV